MGRQCIAWYVLRVRIVMVLLIDATDGRCEIVIEVQRGVFEDVEAVCDEGELVVEDVFGDTSTYGVEVD